MTMTATSSYIDPNLLVPQPSAGHAVTLPEGVETIIDSINNLVGADAYTVKQAIAAPGAIDPAYSFHTLAIDGTDAFTLADGTRLGQLVTVFCLAGTNIPVGTITPATPLGYATVTALGALGDCVTFKWLAAGWVVIACNGVTFT
jgi:hypothetical protein